MSEPMTDTLDPIQQLMQKNAERLGRIGQAGYDPDAFVKSIRLEALIDAVFHPGSPLRSTFEAWFHARLEAELDQADSRIAREKLTEGVPSAVSVLGQT